MANAETNTVSTTTVDLPAQTLTVLDAPTSLTEAVKHLDTYGNYAAVVAVPTADMMGEREGGFDAFYDNLCNLLTTDADAFSMTYQVLAAAPDGNTLYVRVSNNLAEYLHANPDFAAENGIALPHPSGWANN